MSRANELVHIYPPPSWAPWAKNHNLQRAKKLHEEGWTNDTFGYDKQWIGDLGEVGIHDWFRYHAIEHQWFSGLTSESQVKGDFRIILGDYAVQVKTAMSDFPVTDSWFYAITLRQIPGLKDYDQLLFCTFEKPKNRLTIAGGITPTEFVDESTKYMRGEYTPNRCFVKEAMRNVEIEYLMPPLEWLERLKNQTLTKRVK